MERTTSPLCERSDTAFDEQLDDTPSSFVQREPCAGRRVGSTEEHGISLLMALITLAFLSTVGGGVAVYTSSNLRHSYTDQSSAAAYHLAEAGLSEAISQLAGRGKSDRGD